MCACPPVRSLSSAPPAAVALGGAAGRNRPIPRALLWVLAALVAWLAAPFATAAGTDAQVGASVAVPEALVPWIPWVLHGEDRRGCPLDAQAAAEATPSETSPTAGPGGGKAGARLCDWPGRLLLDLDGTGGLFVQRWTLYAQSWVPLPGDADSWPLDVHAGERAVPVVLRDGLPAVRLGPGTHLLVGRFAWSAPPDGLGLAPETGLVDLVMSGAPVAVPRVDRGGRLWLAEPAAGAADAEVERLTVRVYRRIEDDLPLRVLARLELEAAGRARQVSIGPVLLPGGLPLRLQSPLPARLEPDGRLTVQLRPGTWVLEVESHHTGPVADLAPPRAETPWPASEVWSFAARPDLRQVDLAGGLPVDPRQAGVPAAWSRLPALRLAAGEGLRLTERRRGDPDPGPDRLRLARDLWLDFDGGGFSVRDRLSGELTRSWRLAMLPPLTLGQVRIDGEPRPVGRLTPDAPPGVEVRQGRLDLGADARLPASARLPAGGWDLELDAVETALHLPPGWDLLAVSGVDNLPASWLARWTLLDLFLVLVAALGVGRLWGPAWGGLALAALGLTWQMPDAPRLVWLHVLAAAALLAALPVRAAGTLLRLRTAVRWYFRLALLVLLAVGLPFLAGAVRDGFFPHLERPYARLASGPSLGVRGDGAAGSAHGPSAADALARPLAPSPAAAPLPAPAPDDERALAEPGAETGPAGPSWDAAPPLAGSQAPAPGAGPFGDPERESAPGLAPESAAAVGSGAGTGGPGVADAQAPIQSGLGVPDWRWVRFDLRWGGPVAPGEQARVWLLGPAGHLAWSLAGALLAALLGLRMAGLLGGPPRSGNGIGAAAGLGASPDDGEPSGAAPGAGTRTALGSGPGTAPDPLPASAPAGASLRPCVSAAPPQCAADPQSAARAAALAGGEVSVWDAPSMLGLGPEQDGESRLSLSLSLALAGWLALVTAVAPPPALAGEIPSPELLAELKSRLQKPPDCVPDCVDLASLGLKADPETLTLTLELDAAERVAAPVPGGAGGWVPRELILDGTPLDRVRRDPQDRLLVPLEPGRHRLVLAGPLPARTQVEIPFPLRPRQVHGEVAGWSLEGLDEAGRPGAQVRLVRREGPAADAEDTLEPGELPPLLAVERRLELDLDWRVRTRAWRLSPAEFPVVLSVPLVPGESVLTPGAQVGEGSLLLSLAPGETGSEWLSRLPRTPSLALAAGGDPRIAETWVLSLGPRWHGDWQGPAPVQARSEGARRLPAWRPLPGETLELAVVQPTPEPGPTLVLDRVDYRLRPGRRAADAELKLAVRSTRGGRHTLELPAGAIPTRLLADGRDLPLPAAGGALEIPLVPASQRVLVQWREPLGERAAGGGGEGAAAGTGERAGEAEASQAPAGGLKLVLRPGLPDLGSRAVSLNLAVDMPDDRWILLAPGPAVGPVVLFWALLPVLALAGWGLARTGLTPLRTWDWLLLGVGLALAELMVVLLVAGWLLALGLRRGLSEGAPRWRYNGVQVGLVLLTAAALAGLAAAVSQGLLGSPEMQIAGNGSAGGQLAWYQDRGGPLLPQVSVISLPMGAYRALMLAWALWLAVALLKWLRWGWEGFSRPVIWRESGVSGLRGLKPGSARGEDRYGLSISDPRA